MLTAKEAWQATLGQLQLQLSRATFDTWLKGAELMAYEDGEFTIWVRHAYAKDWIEKHLNHLVKQTLSSIFNRSVQINYIVYLSNEQQVERKPGTLWATEPESIDEAELSEWDPRISGLSRRTARHNNAFHTPLNERYTFENFIVGPSNDFAHAAAQAIGETLGSYNPLYIYGGVGLGKTHLLQAIGHACQDQGHAVMYITAESFMNELVMAIRAHKMEEFRERYRSTNVLLVDDFQFMAGKTATEEEFYHTFNAIFTQNGQIVVAADRPPSKIAKLDERLLSRFEGGLQADIHAPELETRIEILESKSAAQGKPLPEDVARMLAETVTSNIRELEGALTQVLARAHLSKQPLTITLAQMVLFKKKGGAEPVRKGTANLGQVLEAAASYHQLSLDDLMSKKRTKDIVRARQIAMYLAREETDATLPQIGDALGGRDHSTVLHGYQKIAEEVEQDDELKREVSFIRRQLYFN